MSYPRRPLPTAFADRRRVAFRLAPLLVFFAMTVGVGLVHAVLQSLALAGPPALDPARETMSRWYAYHELLTRPDLLRSLGHTVYVAAVSAVGCVTLGSVGAYLLWRAPEWVRRAGAVYRLPIILPHIVVAFITVLFWSETGLVASLLRAAGVVRGTAAVPRVLFAGHGVGPILAYVYKGFPFVMLMSLGVLDRVPERLVTTATMLGAGPVRVFGAVVLPLLAPLLNQLFIILFLYALGGFDIPWILGASRPQMIPMTVYALYFQGSLADRSIAMAALVLLAATAGLFVVVYARIARRLSARERPV